MNTRRTSAAAESAAAEASQAARVLQQRAQESRSARQETLHLPTKAEASPEPSPEPSDDGESRKDQPPPRQIKRGDPVRDGIMEDIRRARGEPQEDEHPAEPAAPEPVAAPQQTVATEPAVEPAAPAQEAPKLVKVKVDGVESEVPEADVEAAGGLKSYQLQKAGENRLAKVNEALEQTRQTQAAILRMAQQQQQPAAPQQTPDEFLRAKMDAIRFGTPEEGAAAFQEAIARLNPRIDQNQIIAQATLSMKRDMAVQAYQREFQDVLANPMFKKLSDILEREALSAYVQNGQADWGRLGQLDWGNFYTTIGTQIRGAVPRQSQPPAPTQQTAGHTSPVPSDKEARKASIVEPPKAAAARATLPEEPKPETREESLNAMRRSRGLPVY